MILYLLLLSLTSALPTREDLKPKYEYDGFQFRPPAGGDWSLAPDQAGVFLFVKRTGPESTVVVEVRMSKNAEVMPHAKTADEFFKNYQNSLISDAVDFNLTRNEFRRLSFRDARCLSIDQLAQDRQKRWITMKGMVCLHPKDENRHIRIVVSEQVPNYKKLTSPSDMLEALYQSLEFK